MLYLTASFTKYRNIREYDNLKLLNHIQQLTTYEDTTLSHNLFLLCQVIKGIIAHIVETYKFVFAPPRNPRGGISSSDFD